MNATVTPRRWEIYTGALLALSAAYAAFGLLNVLAWAELWRALTADGRSVWSTPVEIVAGHATGIDDGSVLLVIGFVVARRFWQRDTERLLTAAGRPDARATGHWATRAWAVAFVLSFLIELVAGGLAKSDLRPAGNATLGEVAPTKASVLAAVQAYTAGTALRVLALALLFYGVWHIRGRVRRVVAHPAVRIGRGSASPAAGLPGDPAGGLRLEQGAGLSVRSAGGVVTGGSSAEPPADDEFWDRVQLLAVSAGAELPMLESTPGRGRRWSLLPATGSVGAVRAAVPPGSRVTVFPESPQPGARAPKRAPAAPPGTEWFGLIQEPGTGTLSFQLLLPTRLPQWLAGARKADRYGLYRADDEGALTAVTPPDPTSDTVPGGTSR